MPAGLGYLRHRAPPQSMSGPNYGELKTLSHPGSKCHLNRPFAYILNLSKIAPCPCALTCIELYFATTMTQSSLDPSGLLASQELASYPSTHSLPSWISPPRWCSCHWPCWLPPFSGSQQSPGERKRSPVALPLPEMCGFNYSHGLWLLRRGCAPWQITADLLCTF